MSGEDPPSPREGGHEGPPPRPPGPPPFRPPPSGATTGPVMFVHPQQLAGRPLFAAPPPGPPYRPPQPQHRPPFQPRPGANPMPRPSHHMQQQQQQQHYRPPPRRQPTPVSSQPIQNTSWSEVTCDDGSKFWHNNETGQSSWKEPGEVAAARKLDPKKREMLERAKAMGAVLAPEFEAVLAQNKDKTIGKERNTKASAAHEEQDEEYDVTFDEEELFNDDNDNDDKTKQQQQQSKALPTTKTTEDVAEAFKQVLQECGVHAFSLWERELPKFKDNPHYKSLSAMEARRVFDEFCKDAVGKPLPGAKPKTMSTTTTKPSSNAAAPQTTAAKERAFKALLVEKNITASSRWSDTQSLLSKDDRYKALLPHRRESLFRDHVAAQRKAEDARREAERRGEAERRAAEQRQRDAGLADAIANYKTLLTEAVRDPYDSWRETRPRLERDPQGRGDVKLLDSSIMERLFREHCEDLEDAAEDGYLDLLEEILGTIPPVISTTGDATPAAAAATNSDDGDNNNSNTSNKIKAWTDWETAEALLELDPRFSRLSSSRVREKMWSRYVEDMRWNVAHPSEKPQTQRRRHTKKDAYNNNGGKRGRVDKAYAKEYLDVDKKRIRRD